MGAQEVEAVILCGGLGTRLRESEPEQPKAMVSVNGTPFLEMMVNVLRKAGFHRFVFCTGYKGDMIRDYFGQMLGPSAVFSEEAKPLGTAGAFKHCERLTHAKTLLVMNGDSYCALDFEEFLRAHEGKSGVATLAVRSAGARKDGGYVSVDHEKRIQSFGEKIYDPSLFLSLGIYVFDRSIFGMIPLGRTVSFEQEVFPSLIGKGIYAYETPTPLYDIGTPDRLSEFRNLFAKKAVT